MAITLAIYPTDSRSMFPSSIQDVCCLVGYLLRYVLNGRGAVLRFPIEARDLAFLQNIQISSGFTIALYTVVTLRVLCRRCIFRAL
jgi:hypothetical protein